MNAIKKIIRNIILAFAKPSIIFESTPDFSDNTMPVYQEFLRRGYGKKYYLLWYDKNEHIVELCKNNKMFRDVSIKTLSISNKLRLYSANYKVELRICCNRFLLKKKNKEMAFFLGHGSPIKDLHNYYTLPLEMDYCLAASSHSAAMISYAMKYPKERTFGLGYPRNDVLREDLKDNLSYILGSHRKFIVWYPTFRQHKENRNATDSCITLPIIHDADMALKLDRCAREHDVLIILKPHFAQDVNYITELKLSNVVFIDDEFFKKNNITSYMLVASCDALLTDYSSIYYDYLLCDRPIGLIWEDIEQYKKNPGLIENYEYYCKGGYKIYTIDDLCKFINDVALNVDELKKERKEICDIMNFSNDGNNTTRVVDFIIEKARI